MGDAEKHKRRVKQISLHFQNSQFICIMSKNALTIKSYENNSNQLSLTAVELSVSLFLSICDEEAENREERAEVKKEKLRWQTETDDQFTPNTFELTYYMTS